MATQRIGSNRISNLAVTGDKITNYSVTGEKLSNTAITDSLGYTAGNESLVSSSFDRANGAFARANTTAETLETAYSHANGAFLAANTALATSVDSFARNHANGAFDKANTAFLSTGGSISGNVIISDTSYTFSQSESNYATHRYVLHGETTDATETEIFVGGVSNSRIPVGANTTVSADIQMIARRTDVTGESAGWNLKVACDNFNGTVADSGNVYEIIVHTDDANYLVDARSDDTNDSLNIYVTGVAGKSISWAAVVTTVEVSQ